ncbi:MFS transporter [Marinobacterium arenosum]|uniref:MFS transporter n=1 Tax=Marinobacterium arenosum TaxID=2862496 RepID=UPI001C98A1DB|nr:MFS transporter [Marinobacterium arenosum]MBY4678588.1 MFS transporter [Marinobacterium arenosum]
MQDYYQQNPSARWLALLSICIATFLVPLSMSSVNLALPAIAADLHADAVKVSWMPTINLWGSMILMLPAGRVADMIGRKRVYLIGVMFYALASLMVLAVNSIEWLLVARVLQGLASALVFATAMAIVGSVFSDGDRGTALGLTATSVYLGLTCGPLIGGWLTEFWGWRSVFWAPVPLTLLSLLLVVLYLKGEWKSEQRERLDWLGSGLFALWTSLFFFGLSGLPEPRHGLLALLGLACLPLFIFQQNRARYPLIRIRAMRDNRVFTRSIMASLFMYGANYPILFLLSLYLQYIQGMSPGESGQLILIQALIMAALAPLAGRLSDRYEPRLIATAGCLLFGAGFATLFWLRQDSGLSHVVAGLVLLGIGFGLFSTPNNNAALGSVPKERLSIASALLNLARTLGNMFGMAVVVLLFNQLIGDRTIEPSQYPALLTVTRLALALACGYTLIAAYNSFRRGNIRS